MSSSRSPIHITEATTADDFAAFGALVTEYVGWCRTRYAEHQWFVERVFGYQSLDAELAGLSTAYAPPRGRAFLARIDGVVCGGGAYRRRDDGSCEMKRLFVPDRFKGQGIGRALCEALFAGARADGYTRMVLDTAHLMTEAIAMYHSFGFREREPYIQYPDDLMPFVVFMERRLDA